MAPKRNPHNSTQADGSKKRRDSYESPCIKEFGQVGPLTQAGSMGQPEAMGMAMGMPTML